MAAQSARVSMNPFRIVVPMPSGRLYLRSAVCRASVLRVAVRIARRPALVLLAMVALAACKEPWNHNSSNANAYTISGTVSGLQAGTQVVLAVAGLSLTVASNGGFTFGQALANGTSYSVSVAAQPSGEECLVANGSGTVASANVTGVTVSCSVTVANAWTWFGGSANATSQRGSYGTLGSEGPANVPGSRSGSLTWTDSSGNLWMFGGFGVGATGPLASNLNDLWRFDRSTLAWAWMAGSSQVDAPGTYGTRGTAASANTPGARSHAVAWRDASGNFWLFGGYGRDGTGIAGYLADLWKFTPPSAASTAGTWTWVGGSAAAGSAAGVYGTRGTAAAANQPGARIDAVSWTDSTGNLWLFGGSGYDSLGQLGDLNDLWQYNVAAGTWIWVGGSSTGGAIAGVYGTLGSAAPANAPGARSGAVAWSDASGNLWLFGGTGYDTAATLGPLDDLWQYSRTSGTWTWVGGSDTAGATAGNYGAMGIAAAANHPGARAAASAVTDHAGNLWLFGGAGYDVAGKLSLLNDLWTFSPATGEWTWIAGSSSGGVVDGIYGTEGIGATSNAPGARRAAAMWADLSGNLWLFGGNGYDATSALADDLNDIWQYTP